MKIKFIKSEVATVCAYYRMYLPVIALKRNTNWQVSCDSLMRVEDLTTHDILVIQWAVDQQIWQNIKYAQAHGVKVIYDFDDNLLAVPKHSSGYDVWGNPVVIENLKEILRTVDAVTVSTETLAEVIRPLNPNVYVIPNAIDFESWDKWNSEKINDGITTIGWQGSPSHWIDIALYAKQILRVLEENPGVRLKVLGWDFTNNNYFREVRKQITFVKPTLPHLYGQYMKDVDIGIAPLENCAFNKSKSNLKYIEYSALEIPTIASNIEPYHCITDGINGILINNPKEFYLYLSMLINNPNIAKQIGSSAGEFVKSNFDINKNIEQRINIYKTLIKEKILWEI